LPSYLPELPDTGPVIGDSAGRRPRAVEQAGGMTGDLEFLGNPKFFV
jgi:hypothetical protein